MKPLTLVTGAVAGLSAHAWVNSRLLRRPPLPAPTTSTRVSVLLPVRNEEHHVIACLASILGPTRRAPTSRSSCSTTGRRTAPLSCSPRSTTPGYGSSRAPRSPDGWLGKPWACQQLADAATGDKTKP